MDARPRWPLPALAVLVCAPIVASGLLGLLAFRRMIAFGVDPHSVDTVLALVRVFGSASIASIASSVLAWRHRWAFPLAIVLATAAFLMVLALWWWTLVTRYGLNPNPLWFV